jgi:hypothetical protein
MIARGVIAANAGGKHFETVTFEAIGQAALQLLFRSERIGPETAHAKVDW